MPNLRLALRTLLRTPFVTAVAVISLALGIGATSAIYSLFDQMLLRPLPVPDPGRLVNISGSEPNPVYQSCNIAGDCDVVFSYAMFRDLEAKNTVLSGLAGHFLLGVNLSYHEQPMSGQGNLVSGSYFPTLGLRPALGRLLTPDDDRGIGNGPVAVLSYEAWQARFGADPGVVGQPLAVNGQLLTIVGVAPPGFAGTVLGRRPMVYVPLSMRGVVTPGWEGFEDRRDYWVYAFGRLKPGVTLAQARAGLNAVYHPIITEVEAPLQQGMSEATMVRFKAGGSGWSRRWASAGLPRRSSSDSRDTTRLSLRWQSWCWRWWRWERVTSRIVGRAGWTRCRRSGPSNRGDYCR